PFGGPRPSGPLLGCIVPAPQRRPRARRIAADRPHVPMPDPRREGKAAPMRHEDMPMALTYDDVLLVPQRSSVASRSDVDTSAQLTPNIRLAVPIVSANM